MKKLEYKIPLKAEEIDLRELPAEGCIFAEGEGDFIQEGVLAGVILDRGRLVFLDGNSKPWLRCAKIESRYPRDVPEGLPPLPKPFLAYVGLEKDFPGVFRDQDSNIKESSIYEFHADKNSWVNDNTTRLNSDKAVDVSTKWASKNFPEIVEAMEYEAIKHSEKDKIQFHKLGDKKYTLDWELFSYKIKPNQIVDANKKVEPNHIPDAGEMVEKEPPGFLEIYTESDLSFDSQDELELLFLAGKRRGRWEAAQQKYNTAKEAYLATGGGETSFPIFQKIWNMARELKEGGSGE